MPGRLLKNLRNRLSLSSLILAVLYALFTLLGYIFKTQGGWDYLRHSRGDQAGVLAAFFLITAAYYFIIQYLFRLIDRKVNANGANGAESLRLAGPARTVSRWISGHAFLCALILIALCWLPYLIIQYPGNVSWDAMVQLYQSVEITQRNNYFPYISTVFFGFLFSLGRSVYNDNFGVFCIVLVQFITCAMVFAAIAKYVLSLCGKLRFYFAVIAFFTLYPVFPNFATTVIKETAYTALFTLFVLLIAYFLTFEKASLIHIIGLACVGLGLSLFRNEAIAVVVVSFIALIVTRKPLRIKLIGSLASIGVVVLLVNFVALPNSGISTISGGMTSEAMSLSFQQTARYIRDFGDEVTEEEQRVIEEAFRVDDYRVLGRLYMPDLADPVKGGARKVENYSEYIRVWSQMFRKHPAAYIQATINGTYGYYSPFEFIGIKEYYFDYIESTATEAVPPEDRLDIYHIADKEWGGPDAVRKAGLVRYMYTWIELPVIKWTIASLGFYTWLLLFLLVYMIRKRARRACIIFAAPLTILLLCTMSPVNGLLRYELPMIACMPVLIAFCMHYRPVQSKAGK